MVCLRNAGGSLSQTLPELLAAAARVYNQSGPSAAAVFYCEILEHFPDQPEALFNLGNIAHISGDNEAAARFFEVACTSDPKYAAAWFNRSLVLRQLGQRQEAINAARKAADLSPNYGPAWDFIAQLLTEEGLYNAAIKNCARALGLEPQNAKFHGNYAMLLMAMGNVAGAYHAAKLASALDPAASPLLLGNCLKAMGYPALAVNSYALAHVSNPAFREAEISEAMARLQIGDLEKGWALWEKRPDFMQELHGFELWGGEFTKHLLLYEDQGIGDAIQFLRYIPHIKDRAQEITVRVGTPLKRLVQQSFPEITLIDETDPLPNAYVRCRLSSLPFLCKTNLTNIPDAPYLQTSPDLGVKWQKKLSVMPSPRIGLVWAGNPQFRNDLKRSLPPSLLPTFLADHKAHFISLQKDRAEPTPTFLNAAPELSDFAESAALIAELDLVITVDTAIAHLAGALGKPVWILLAFDNDWRWMIGREDSPWYPSARLFRQEKPGDWTDVLFKLSKELNRFIKGDRSVLTPLRWSGSLLEKNPYALAL